MRIKLTENRIYHHLDERTRSVFLWWPLIFDGEANNERTLRWLERVTLEEEYDMYTDKWKLVAWSN